MSDDELLTAATAASTLAASWQDQELAEVLEDLSRPQKRLPTRLLYDERGSRLFERICETQDYYVTRVERALLEQSVRGIASFVGAGAGVIEPGAGCGSKTRLLLQALQTPRWYAPMDIDPSVLWRCRLALREALPGLKVRPHCADFTQALQLQGLPPARRRLIYFPGSTIGNFEPVEAARLLRRFRDAAGEDGLMLLGVDLRKSAGTLRRAYDDSEGVTARFNLNLLVRLNREYGADFDPDGFAHQAIYDKVRHRIEMHLLSRRAQRVRIAGRVFRFAEGETIHTESSHKYLPSRFALLAAAAGWTWQRLWLDPQRRFALMGFQVLYED